MRILTLTAAAVAMASTSLASPAFAQDDSSDARKILGRVLTAVLGDDEEEAAAETEATGDATFVLTPRQKLAVAVADDARGEANPARDQYRNPAQTIEFFRIEPGMTVVDHFPGGAYYTDILVPYLGEDGHYIGGLATVPVANDEQKERQRAFPERFPQLVAESHAESGISGATITAINTETMAEDAAGTVDRVMIVRMMHNIHRWGMAHDQLTKFRDLLKDDGLLGIVQHRAPTGAPYSYANGEKGYMRQEDVIKLVEAHGFDLVATSEINANPRDPANHEAGVWYLPPRLAGTEETDVEERARRQAYGESDRMTLLFRKRP